MSSTRRGSARRRHLSTLLIVLLAMFALAGGTLAVYSLVAPQDASSKVLGADTPDPGYDPDTGIETLADGTRIQSEDPVSADQVREMDVKPAKGRLRVPSVDVDAPLLSMHTYQHHGVRTITPPTHENPYVVRDWAEPGDTDGMVVVATHSTRGRPDLPGSRLIDIDRGSSTVQKGAYVFVDGHKYVVSKVHNQSKGTVADDQDVWKDEPGKLLLITCLQRPAGKSQQNVIIEAHLAGMDDASDAGSGE